MQDKCAASIAARPTPDENLKQGNRIDVECTVDGCDRPVKVKLRGLCWRHYKKWYRYGDPNAGGTYRYNAPSCTTVGCQRKPYARDMCHPCYKRWWKWRRRMEGKQTR